MKKIAPLLYLAGTSFAVVLIFVIYLTFVGIPKTQARNFYNQALKQIENDEEDKAKASLLEGLKFWDERYIGEEFEKLK